MSHVKEFEAESFTSYYSTVICFPSSGWPGLETKEKQQVLFQVKSEYVRS